MASEFYAQLGVDRAASGAKIRSAYATAVARLAKRRRALLDQGGDTLQIDLERARLDEAWEVLSNPVRRRRYDVMLTWTEGARPKQLEPLWAEVNGALVHPAAAVAAKLLRVTSRLTEIGALPLAPSEAADEPPTLVPHDDDLTTPRAARLGQGNRTSPGRAGPGEVTRLGYDRLAMAPSGPTLVQPGSTAGGDVDAEPEVGVAVRVEHSLPPPAAPHGHQGSVYSPSILQSVEPLEDLPLRVVDGSPRSSEVFVLPSAPREGAPRAGGDTRPDGLARGGDTRPDGLGLARGGDTRPDSYGYADDSDGADRLGDRIGDRDAGTDDPPVGFGWHADPPDAAPPAASLPSRPPAPPTSPPPRPAPPPLPPPPPRPTVRALPAEDVAKLIDEFGYGGMLLRVVRERVGVRLSDISDHTRISIRYLEAIESEEREDLPSATFVRGYVREMARTLHLDADAVVAGFMRRLDG